MPTTEHDLSSTSDAELLIPALQRMGLVQPGQAVRFTPLTGGVSSLILKVQTDDQVFCVKRALPQLKVKALWEAPVKRNRDEVAWLRFAHQVLPQAVPAVLGDDEQDMVFAMAYLDSQTHPVWKQQLLDGVIHTHTAQAVAQRLAGLHAASARQPALLSRFDHDDDFVAIRLSPYFLHTARQQPSVANSLEQLVAQTLAHRSVLVHGDVSPKNVLVGPLGPVFLDAECACWGDPAFDLAFVLNHLLLKAVWQPAYAPALRSSFDALHTAYLAAVDWEDRDALEARTCHVLAGLLLARIDGKSPVEYLTQTHQHDFVRRQAMAWLHQPAKRLAHMALAWNPS